MEGISLTSRSASWRMENVAKLLALKAAELLTSWRVSCVLAFMAFIGVMLYQSTGEHPVLMVCLTFVWALHFAAMASIDIFKKGGEL